jgi:hypothetical protein
MNYILIFGVIGLIALIAVVSYFMLGKKEGINDGKYIGGDSILYDYIIKGDTLILEPKSGSGKQRIETKIIKTDIKAGFDKNAKQQFFYKTQNIIDGKTIYLSQTQDEYLNITDTIGEGQTMLIRQN